MFMDFFDLSSEKNMYEAIMYLFACFAMEFYFIIVANILFNHSSGFQHSVLASLILHTFVPVLFCTLVLIMINKRKNLKDVSATNSIIWTICLTCLFPNILGAFLGLIPVAIASTKEDNSLDMYERLEKSEMLKNNWILEKQLQQRKAIEIKREEMNKILQTR